MNKDENKENTNHRPQHRRQIW